jgi:hypothetical protein
MAQRRDSNTPDGGPTHFQPRFGPKCGCVDSIQTTRMSYCPSWSRLLATSLVAFHTYYYRKTMPNKWNKLDRVVDNNINRLI